jgi:hypothetical protein
MFAIKVAATILLLLNGIALTFADTGQSSNGPIHVDGAKYALTQAGIQQALLDACALSTKTGGGREVYLPEGIIALANTMGQQFLVPCALHVHGPGTEALWFVIQNNVPKTIPVFRVQPATPLQAWFIFDNFRITSVGSVGGDAFLLDATKAPVNHFILQHVHIGGLDHDSWSVNMTSIKGDSFFFGRISDSVLSHGIKMNRTSTDDSWLIEHNAFNSYDGGRTPCIDATTQAGAAHITMFNNNGGCAGGFFISHGTNQCQILYNQIEQPSVSTEANSAVIDLIGDAFKVTGCKIVGNNINAHEFARTNIRLGAATGSVIDDNVISVQPRTGVGIEFTASSTGTILGLRNEFLGLGGGALATSGPGTHYNFSRIVVGGPVPTCSITGFGKGATCIPQEGSTDTGGQLSFVPGIAPGPSGTISLNFSGSFGNTSAFCVFMPINIGQAWNPRASLIGVSSNKNGVAVSWDNNGVSFGPSGSIGVHYWCGGR